MNGSPITPPAVAHSDVLDELGAAIEAALPGAVRRNVSVAELTTYRLGGPLAVLVRVADDEELRVLSGMLAAGRPAGRNPSGVAPRVLVVGRGSNLLVADEGFDGLAIMLTGSFETVTPRPTERRVIAGAAAPLPVVARRAAAAGLAGLEFYVGIPGSVGGAVRMNAGGHGSETRDVLHRAWVVHLDQGDDAVAVPLDAAALDLSYRHSNLDARSVVTKVELIANPDEPAVCEARLAEVVRWRREHQPGGSNAGSVFRNPPGDAAGRLIDAAGGKGLRVGGAVVSEKHANFFQAEPDATAADVRDLVIAVRRLVHSATGVILEPELQMVGFGDEPVPPLDPPLDQPLDHSHEGRGGSS